MSKHTNVNPDHYKLAGRERPGHAVPKQPKEAESGTEQTRASRWRQRQRQKSKKI
jgi:hypothetical protein